MPLLEVGQIAHAEVLGVGAVTGRVRLVSPEIDRTTHLGHVRIALPTGKELLVGGFARATIDAGQSCGISVPTSAVLLRPAGPVVQVVQNGHISTRPVELGLASNGRWEIRKGLTKGETIVAQAGAFLHNGDAVRPVATEQGGTTGGT